MKEELSAYYMTRWGNITQTSKPYTVIILLQLALSSLQQSAVLMLHALQQSAGNWSFLSHNNQITIKPLSTSLFTVESILRVCHCLEKLCNDMMVTMLLGTWEQHTLAHTSWFTNYHSMSQRHRPVWQHSEQLSLQHWTEPARKVKTVCYRPLGTHPPAWLVLIMFCLVPCLGLGLPSALPGSLGYKNWSFQATGLVAK